VEDYVQNGVFTLSACGKTRTIKGPFTGIFSENGTLLREVKFVNDPKLHKMQGGTTAILRSKRGPRIQQPVSVGSSQDRSSSAGAVGKGAPDTGEEGRVAEYKPI